MSNGVETSGAAGQDLPPHLAADRSIHVVISVLSGTQRAQTYYEDTLAPFLTKHNIKYTSHTTESTASISQLTHDHLLPQALSGVQQTIILLSGDGGVIDMVNGLGNNLMKGGTEAPGNKTYVKPIICLFPQGTANALAWSSKIASDPLQVMMQGRPRPIPIFQATFSADAKLVTNEGTELQPLPGTHDGQNPQICGAVVFSWGLHASLVAKSDTREYRQHGLERFRMAAKELMQENHAYKGTIQMKRVDSTQWQPLSPSDPSLTYLAVTLVSNLEEHYCISPDHQPLSDVMHVIHIPHLTQSEIGELTFLPYQGGKHVHDPRVVYEAIDELKIEVDEDSGSWRQICVDGQIIQLPHGGWAHVKRLKSISVVDVVAPGEI